MIDVDGLRMFVKELESLPCTLPALEPLRVRGTVMCGMGGVGGGYSGEPYGLVATGEAQTYRGVPGQGSRRVGRTDSVL